MSKAVQSPAQARYNPLQRDDGAVLLQLSERTTVYVPAAPAPPLPVAATDRYDPDVFGEVPTAWTWDLVHCRLQVVAEVAKAMPGVKRPSGLRSFLGALQPETSRVGRVLSPAEVTRLDWTWLRVSCHSEVDRAVLMGIMLGLKLAMIVKITKALKHRGIGVERPIQSKTAAHRRYRMLTEAMALEWIGLREPVDAATRAAWIARMEKKQ